MKIFLIIAAALVMLMLHRKEIWDNMPWAKEAYQEPALQESSVP